MTVPESAAAVFERVLAPALHGILRASKPDNTGCIHPMSGQTWIPKCEVEARRLAAQLATALAQPDTLGDGVGEQVKALREAAASARLMEADGWVPAWLEDRADALLTQPSATSERGGRDG